MFEIDPIELGKQLKNPRGETGKTVAEFMNTANASKYVLMFDSHAIGDGEKILEIGFGNGKFFPMYFEKSANVSVAGIDYSETMVSEATRLNSGLTTFGKLCLNCGDSISMPYADGQFDKVVSVNTVYFWDDTAAQLCEIKRVLKKSGKVILGYTPGSMMTAPQFTKDVFNLYEPVEVETMLEKSGFKNISTVSKKITRKTYDGSEIEMTDVCTSGEK